MNIYSVNYEETYQGDPYGRCDTGRWGPWSSREEAEKAVAFLKTRTLGKAHNFKPLYDRLEIEEEFVSDTFDEKQVW